jgi:tetratricopeptide (TPR) repeat protein
VAETDYFEKTPKRANRWFVYFIVLSVLFGITFSLSSVFNWIFFLGAGYSLFMSYFLLPVQPKIFQARSGRAQGAQFNTSVADPAAKRKKAIIIIVSLFFFVTFFIPFMVNLIGGSSDDTTEETTTDASSDVPDDSPKDFIGSANDFFNNQQYDSAEKYYDKALEADPNQMEGYYGKGIVAYNRENIDVANTYFLKAYEGGFRFGWLSWALGDMYDKQGQTTHAITMYKESANLDSTNVDNYKRLAELEPANRAKYLELAQKYASK